METRTRQRARWFVSARHAGPYTAPDQPAPPYGLQHAREPGTSFALCGAGVLNWRVFWHLRFEPFAPSTCQPCSEIAFRAIRR